MTPASNQVTQLLLARSDFARRALEESHETVKRDFPAREIVALAETERGAE